MMLYNNTRPSIKIPPLPSQAAATSACPWPSNSARSSRCHCRGGTNPAGGCRRTQARDRFFAADLSDGRCATHCRLVPELHGCLICCVPQPYLSPCSPPQLLPRRFPPRHRLCYWPSAIVAIMTSRTTGSVKSWTGCTPPGTARVPGSVAAIPFPPSSGFSTPCPVSHWIRRRFSLGSGLTDPLRRNSPPVGTKITYRYRELTKNGMPRFPRYLRVRVKL